MHQSTLPKVPKDDLAFRLRQLGFALLTLGAFIAIFGVPYVRVDQSVFDATYSNGLDRFRSPGDIAPLILLVPFPERASQLGEGAIDKVKGLYYAR